VELRGQALSNPLVQQLMAADPYMAQQAQMLRSNPGLIQEMMSNPMVQQVPLPTSRWRGPDR
jgi:hypothetical protein